MGRREGTALGGPGVGGRNRRIFGLRPRSRPRCRRARRGGALAMPEATENTIAEGGTGCRLTFVITEDRWLSSPIAKISRFFSEIIDGDPYKGYARVMSQPFLKRQGSSNTILTERILNRGSRFDSVNYRSCDGLPLVCTARRRKRKEKAARNNRENSVCGNNRCMP